MAVISNIIGREILDSRGNPTIEVDVVLQDGTQGRAAVPSGASTGSHEMQELRDNDTRYHGQGVRKAIAKIKNDILPVLRSGDFDQQTLDQTMIELDGTDTKSNLGANTILAISLTFAHAVAKSHHQALFEYCAQLLPKPRPVCLPMPMLNIFNGGKHAENGIDIQEFMIIPVGAPSFSEAIRYGSEIFHTLKVLLKKMGLPVAVGDEGGFAPHMNSDEAVFDIICEAIEQAGYRTGKDIALGIDVAATELYRDRHYHLRDQAQPLSSTELIELYQQWIKSYPIISIEDGLAEDDWDGFTRLTEQLGTTTQIVGDDLFVTNPQRLQTGIERKVCNAIIIKPNQIGTLSETLTTVNIAHNAGYRAIVSHRSGETEDTTIAHCAVGWATGQIKTGSVSRGERTCKYNELLRIEEHLGQEAVFNNPFTTYYEKNKRHY